MKTLTCFYEYLVSCLLEKTQRFTLLFFRILKLYGENEEKGKKEKERKKKSKFLKSRIMFLRIFTPSLIKYIK